MNTRSRFLTGVGLAVVLAVPACGSDAGESAETTGRIPGPTQPAVSAAPTEVATAGTDPAVTSAATDPVTAPAAVTTASRPGQVPVTVPGQPATTPAFYGPIVGTIDRSIVLGADGLGVATIGDAAPTVLAAVTAVLGPPVDTESVYGDQMPLPRDFAPGTGTVMTTYHWQWPELRVVMTDAVRSDDGVEPGQIGDLQFAWWEYDGDPSGARQFATAAGITVGSSKAELDAAHSPVYPGEDCDQQPAPQRFEFGRGDRVTSPGIAGELDDSLSWVVSLRSAVTYCS